MAKMGVPVLKLKAGNAFGKHSGNAKSVACEGLEERHSSDPDLQRDRTNENIYGGRFRSGEELFNYWISEAGSYRILDKNGKEKKLRSDANIGFASILKPEKSFMESLSPRDRIRFLQDAYRVTVQEYQRKGISVDAWVIHLDEQVPHLHLYGHDPEYKLGKKLNLSFFNAMNKRVPERLRALGWDIEDCTVYDVEEAQKMSPEAQKEYKEKRMQEKKEKGYGMSSKAYKAKKDKETVKQQEKRLKLKTKALEEDKRRFEKEKAAQEAEFEKEKAELKKREAEFEQKEALFGQRVREEAMKLAESMLEQEEIQREQTTRSDRRLPDTPSGMSY